MTVQITHIRFAGTTKDHQQITDYQWREDGTSSTGANTKAAMVDWIESKNGVAYVSNGITKANVGVVNPHTGSSHLRTYADGIWSDNLLSLPTF